MVDIVTHLHQYVPCVMYMRKHTLSSGETVEEETASIHRLLLGGDQLTAARIRSAKKVKMNSESPVKRLEGIISTAEDWHTKTNFLGVRDYY